MRCHQATHAFTNSLADFSAESRAWELKLATYVSNYSSEVTPKNSLIVPHTQLLKQGSAEWHKARQGKLTASSFGAASGLSKYVTPGSFWLKATGKIKETYSDQHQQNLEHGNDLEPQVRNLYEKLMGMSSEVRRVLLYV